MKSTLILFYLSCLNAISIAEKKFNNNLITCFVCSGVSCKQPFNLSESSISSSSCAEGCVMQQIKLNDEVVTTIRGCMNNEGCGLTVLNGIAYENTCCFQHLCNSFYPQTTTNTTSTTTTATATITTFISIKKTDADESNNKTNISLVNYNGQSNQSSSFQSCHNPFFPSFKILSFILLSCLLF